MCLDVQNCCWWNLPHDVFDRERTLILIVCSALFCHTNKMETVGLDPKAQVPI